MISVLDIDFDPSFLVIITDACFAYHILGDVARVNGQLAVSRAFGDKNLKLHLRSDPDVQSATIGPDTELLILASDGLWKVIHLSPLLCIRIMYRINPHRSFSINPGGG